jgi:hypothetical protein
MLATRTSKRRCSSARRPSPWSSTSGRRDAGRAAPSGRCSSGSTSRGRIRPGMVWAGAGGVAQAFGIKRFPVKAFRDGLLVGEFSGHSPANRASCSGWRCRGVIAWWPCRRFRRMETGRSCADLGRGPASRQHSRARRVLRRARRDPGGSGRCLVLVSRPQLFATERLAAGRMAATRRRAVRARAPSNGPRRRHGAVDLSRTWPRRPARRGRPGRRRSGKRDRSFAGDSAPARDRAVAVPVRITRDRPLPNELAKALFR